MIQRLAGLGQTPTFRTWCVREWRDWCQWLTGQWSRHWPVSTPGTGHRLSNVFVWTLTAHCCCLTSHHHPWVSSFTIFVSCLDTKIFPSLQRRSHASSGSKGHPDCSHSCYTCKLLLVFNGSIRYGVETGVWELVVPYPIYWWIYMGLTMTLVPVPQWTQVPICQGQEYNWTKKFRDHTDSFYGHLWSCVIAILIVQFSYVMAITIQQSIIVKPKMV